MEPLNDQELDELLKQWAAPPAPETLAKRMRHRQRGAWWRWLLSGSIRVPVPLALALGGVFALMLVFIIAARNPEEKFVRPPHSAVFQPVKRLEPRIIRSSYEANH
jgi:hypothetical protein